MSTPMQIHPVADGSFVGGATVWIATHLATVDHVVSIVSGIATLIAAVVTVVVRLRKPKS